MQKSNTVNALLVANSIVALPAVGDQTSVAKILTFITACDKIKLDEKIVGIIRYNDGITYPEKFLSEKNFTTFYHCRRLLS